MRRWWISGWLLGNLVDELVFVAPKILGADGRPCFNFIDCLMESLFRDVLLYGTVGEDIVMRVRFGVDMFGNY